MTNIHTMSDLHSPAPKTKWFKKPIVWLPVVAATVAFAMGSGSASAQTVEVEKVVTKEVPGPERIKTVEKKVEVTPAVCLQALSLSEEAFDIASAAVGAISERNVTALNGYTADLKAIAPQVNAAKAACRAK